VDFNGQYAPRDCTAAEYFGGTNGLQRMVMTGAGFLV
jgi:hypothetical protein